MIFADQAASLKKFYYKLFFGTPCIYFIFLPQVTKEEFVKNAMKSPFIASLLN